jgi:hypothetical protein
LTARVRRSSERNRSRLWGAPEPADFKATDIGRALGEAATIHSLGRRETEKLLAIEKLAFDVFCDSSSARAFCANPKEYMARAGLSDAKLDINSEEVRLAMAMGDPAVREAAWRGDRRGFVRAVMAQGFSKLSAGVMGGFITVEIAVEASLALAVVAVVYTRAAVLTKAVVGVDVKVEASGPIITAVQRQVDTLARMAEDLGNPALARRIRSAKMRKILERYARLQLKAK